MGLGRRRLPISNTGSTKMAARAKERTVCRPSSGEVQVILKRRKPTPYTPGVPWGHHLVPNSTVVLG